MSQQDVQQVAAMNCEIAALFEEVAERLSERRPNDFRVAIYLEGASTLRDLLWPVDWMLRQEGRAGLENVPGLGRTLARCIEQFVSVGRINVLEQLRGNAVIPWSCPRRRPTLEASLHKARKPPARTSDTRTVNRLPQETRRRAASHSSEPRTISESVQPSLIEQLLSVDAEYRREVALGQLPKITPKRFNRNGEAWLPILHTERSGSHYTVLYSNTEHAHEAGAVGDWVIVHRDDPSERGQWTIMTSQFGSLAGRRLVLGHEAECISFYKQHSEGADPDRGRSVAGPFGSETGHRRHHQLTLFDYP
jgi:hypothetical protein